MDTHIHPHAGKQTLRFYDRQALILTLLNPYLDHGPNPNPDHNPAPDTPEPEPEP